MSRKHRHSPHARTGFTLLELTLVILIISLIAGAGMKMGFNALKTADRVATQEKLNTIKLALDSYAKTYGYLPCPADQTLVATNASFGIESRTGTACTSIPGGVTTATYNGDTTAIYLGLPPVRTLGLPDSYAHDAWGGKFVYAVSTNMTQNTLSYSSNAPAITVRYGSLSSSYIITQRRISAAFTSATNSSGLVNLAFSSPHGISSPTGVVVHVAGTVYTGSYTISSIPDTTHLVLANSQYSSTDSGSAQWLQDGAAAAYVVVSGGADGRGMIPFGAGSVPSGKMCTGTSVGTSPEPCNSSSTVTCIDIENCNGDDTFYDTLFNDTLSTPASYFDDYIVWGSNASQRDAVSTKVYTVCPTTTPATCETWCARCSINFPGADTASPPAGLTNPVLCKKVINSNATNCTAACFWSGNTADGYVKCP